MACYNAYIGTFTTKKKTFSEKFQKIKFFSEYLKVITKIKIDFAQKIKEKVHWQIAGGGKNKIDNLIRPIFNHNKIYHNCKTSQKMVHKAIR